MRRGGRGVRALGGAGAGLHVVGLEPAGRGCCSDREASRRHWRGPRQPQRGRRSSANLLALPGHCPGAIGRFYVALLKLKVLH